MFAEIISAVHIGDLYYNLDTEAQTAEVCRGLVGEQIENLVIHATVDYNGVTFNVTSIGWSVFSDRTDLVSVEIEQGITTIGQSAFYGCKNITSIILPSTLTSLGRGAFTKCEKLSSISIPDGVTNIGGLTFTYCYSLKTISIPASVTDIYTANVSAFYRCDSLLAIDVAAENPNYTSVDGVLFNKEKTTLIHYPAGKLGAYRIPESVTEIASRAFDRCMKLSELEIPQNVSLVGEGAFRMCLGLTSIVCENPTPPTLQSIYDFYETADSIPLYVPSQSIETYQTTNGWSRFSRIQPLENCPQSTHDTIGGQCGATMFWALNLISGVLEIRGTGEMQSYGWRNDGSDVYYSTCPFYPYRDIFTSVISYVMVPPATNAFYDASDKTLYVPMGCITAYQNSTDWNKFKEILPIQTAESEDAVVAPTAEPTTNSVIIEWPKDENAETYTIAIQKGDETIYTLEFDASGQLINSAYAAPACKSHERQALAATQTSTGWQYTIGGLEANTDYIYTVVARRNDTSEVYNTTVPFHTQATPTDIDQIINDQLPITNKVLHNGQILILRGEKVYTVTGQEVR